MTVIYNELTDFTFGEQKINRDARELIAGLCECDYKDVDQYIIDTVMVSLQKYGEIKNAFIPYLNNWTWERLPLLDRKSVV